jgi:endonuclease G, mitochondrial
MRYILISLFSILALAAQAQAPAEPRFAECREVFAGAVPPVMRERTIERCRPGVAGTSFAIAFEPTRKAPIWAGYALTRATAEASSPGRLGDFAADPEIPRDLQARDTDFRRSGWDRGHLVPAAVAGRLSAQTRIAGNWYTNVAAQAPAQNRGTWSRLEAWVRQQARAHGEVQVIVGTVFADELPEARIGTGVAVPSHFFLIVHAPESQGREARIVAFMASNAPDASPEWVALDPLETRLRALETRIAELVPGERRAAVRNAVDAPFWALR